MPVPKSDGSVRLCVDYRGVNKVTAQMHYPIPNLDDLLNKVGKSIVLSKLDLCKGYYQIPLDTDSRDLTAFVTPWGSYRFKMLPFGLRLKFLISVLSSQLSIIVIFSGSVGDHISQVRMVLEAIRESGMKLKRSKCVWGNPMLNFWVTRLVMGPWLCRNRE